MTLTTRVPSRWLLALAAPLALAACGSEEAETYEADAEDLSGGELIVPEETPAVPVDLPETPMTNAPVGETLATEPPTVEDTAPPAAE